MAKKKLNAQRVIQSGLFVFFFCTFVIGAYLTVSTIIEDSKAKTAYKDIQDQIHPTDAPSGDAEKVSIDFDALQSIDKNVKAWINLPGTIVDYPIVQGSDNVHYLRHLITGEYNKCGTLFIDYRCPDPFNDKNTIIYGHHNKQGLMFAEFKNYSSQEYYEKHKTLYLYTPEGTYLLEMLSMTTENGAKEFVRFNLKDDQDFLDYIEGLRRRSTFKSDAVVSKEDQIISFVTCSYEWTNARYLLVAKMTRISEEPAGEQ
ncbi:MAG: class B sortase [Erysipelotrichaceae bacterium]|nr:class B sortase [Erysipelotrichaceae bacterium]MBR5049417.1 class B sortase [Erysipelotrichaceae bacterium]